MGKSCRLYFEIGLNRSPEAIWGTDSLQYHGGFQTLDVDADAAFPSSLTPNGLVSWSSHALECSSSASQLAEATLTVRFPLVDWLFLQSVYGWAALQYQAWARGHLLIESEVAVTVSLYIDNVLEYLIDDKPYLGGDFYAYRNAPVILHLTPGPHKLDIRLIRDVRSMGAASEPEVTIRMKVVQAQCDLNIDEQKLLVSDVVNGRLASPFASVPIRNESLDWINIVSAEIKAVCHASVHCLPATDPFIDKTGCTSALTSPIVLAPGQTYSLAFRIDVEDLLDCSMRAEFALTYGLADQPQSLVRSTFSHHFSERHIYDPHKFTFLHPSGNVSYAILRAPSQKACLNVDHSRGLPVFLGLHGAGIDADSEQVRHTLDPLPDLPSWVLFPSGVTPWSADDWREYSVSQDKVKALTSGRRMGFRRHRSWCRSDSKLAEACPVERSCCRYQQVACYWSFKRYVASHRSCPHHQVHNPVLENRNILAAEITKKTLIDSAAARG